MRPKKKAPRPVKPRSQTQAGPLCAAPLPGRRPRIDPLRAKRTACRSAWIVLTDRPRRASSLPEQLPLLPLRTDVVFPQTVVPLVVNRPERDPADRRRPGRRQDDRPGHPAPSRDRRARRSATCTRPSASARSSRCSSSPTARPGSSARGCSAPGSSRSSPTEPYLVGRVEPLEDVSRRGSSSTPWCTTSTGSSSGWSTRASRCPRSFRSRR